MTPGPVTSENLHALMTDALNVQMARLNALSFELHQTQTELDQERQRRRNEIASAAASLRKAASTISAYPLPSQLGEEDLGLFSTLATALQSHASALEQSALSGQLEALEEQMLQINTTCNTCHSIYRPRK